MIITEHLKLVPMDKSMCEAIVESNRSYFEELSYSVSLKWFTPELIRVVSGYLSMMALSYDSHLLGWLVVEAKTHEIIGDFGFSCLSVDGSVEIEFALIKQHQERGYGSEMLKAMSIWCYLQSEIHKLCAKVKPQNTKSIAILEKAGFNVLEGQGRHLNYELPLDNVPKIYEHYQLESGVGISSCLLGINAKYSGESNLSETVLTLATQRHIVPFCPEQMGGLTTPRQPAEIVSNCVKTEDGTDVTDAFVKGANETVKLTKITQIRCFILKDGSPSCGSFRIYDGTFSGTKINGMGMTCRLLFDKFEQVVIYNENRDMMIK